MKHQFLLTILAFVAFKVCLSQTQITGVAVIAPSVSTSIKAREILNELGWEELPIKKADVLLVVVRSALYSPLMMSYQSYCNLLTDAENQLNIAGTNYHVYLYTIHDDLSVTQLEHNSFRAVN